jgi:CBS domain-containing protein
MEKSHVSSSITGRKHMGLQENLRNENLTRLEIRQPVLVRPGASVRDAVNQMRQQKLGCAVVVDENRKALGVFTESMLVRMLAYHPEQLDDPVEEHMTEQVPWVRQTDPIADVLEAMELKNIRTLCVLDDKDRVVGLTGQRGLMEYIAEHFPGDVTVQRIGLPPYPADREGA